VAEALAVDRVGELAVPTLAEGETLDAVRAEQHDPDETGRPGMHVEWLDQLVMDHLLGLR
jgi:xylose isomerase